MNNKIYCNIKNLNISIPIRFNSEQIKEKILPVVSEGVSKIRLPNYEWSDSSIYNTSKEVLIDIEDKGEVILVEFNFQLFSKKYLVYLKGFHWDFWKVVIASLTDKLLKLDIIVVHAACVEINNNIVLLPGYSGAGKSSVSFSCFESKINVFASELCYIKNGNIIAGNLAASIDNEALEYFAIKRPLSFSFYEEKIIADTIGLNESKAIRRLYFPKARQGKLSVRKITSRRARMLLYENIFGQLPIVQLVSGQTIPIKPIPSKLDLEVISKQISLLGDMLIDNDSYIIEGHPSEIVSWIKNKA